MTGMSRPFAAPCGPAGVARHTIDRARTRILVAGAAFLLAFLAIAARLMNGSIAPGRCTPLKDK